MSIKETPNKVNIFGKIFNIEPTQNYGHQILGEKAKAEAITKVKEFLKTSTVDVSEEELAALFIELDKPNQIYFDRQNQNITVVPDIQEGIIDVN